MTFNIRLSDEEYRLLTIRAKSQGCSPEELASILFAEELHRPPTTDDSEMFRTWLIEVRGYKNTSASVCLSLLRRASRDLGMELPTIEALYEWVASETHAATFSVRKTVVNRWVDFLQVVRKARSVSC